MLERSAQGQTRSLITNIRTIRKKKGFITLVPEHPPLGRTPTQGQDPPFHLAYQGAQGVLGVRVEAEQLRRRNFLMMRHVAFQLQDSLRALLSARASRPGRVGPKGL